MQVQCGDSCGPAGAGLSAVPTEEGLKAAMIIEAARRALSDMFAPEFRPIFFKTLGLTLLALVALWFGLKELFDWLALPWIDALLPGFPSWAGWLTSIAAILAGIGLAIA